MIKLIAKMSKTKFTIKSHISSVKIFLDLW